MKPRSTVLGALSFLALPGVIASVGCGGNGDGSSPSANVGAQCDSARASLEASCAGGMGDIFECWDPSGSCRLEGLGVTFDSGARYEGSITGLDGRYISSSGETCGSFEATNVDSSTGSLTADFMNRQGDTYTISSDGAGGNLTIGCPGGDSVTLTSQEQDALQACTAPLNLCSNSGNPVGPDDFGECTNDGDCRNVDGVTLVCCDYGDQKLCQVREVCETVEQNFGSCNSDNDCTDVGGLRYVCCDVFGVRACIPEQGCGAF